MEKFEINAESIDSISELAETEGFGIVYITFGINPDGEKIHEFVVLGEDETTPEGAIYIGTYTKKQQSY